jgi:hypothetical protein
MPDKATDFFGLKGAAGDGVDMMDESSFRGCFEAGLGARHPAASRAWKAR